VSGKIAGYAGNGGSHDDVRALVGPVLWKFPILESLCFNVAHMIRPIKHDTSAKHRKSRGFKLNVSVHPFMLIAIAAALAVVVFVIVVYFLRYIK
jgi:hypothetical protein